MICFAQLLQGSLFAVVMQSLTKKRSQQIHYLKQFEALIKCSKSDNSAKAYPASSVTSLNIAESVVPPPQPPGVPRPWCESLISIRHAIHSSGKRAAARTLVPSCRGFCSSNTRIQTTNNQAREYHVRYTLSIINLYQPWTNMECTLFQQVSN